MKYLAVLTVLFATAGAFASEVGTQNPQSVEVAEGSVTLALAEKGAGNSWTDEPIKFNATAHQTAKLNERIDTMNAQVSNDLDALIASKLEQVSDK